MAKTKLVIIQSSPPRTVSTLLTNAIYGLIPELFNKNVTYVPNGILKNISENVVVIKTHETDIDKLINNYDHRYKLVFICSERNGMDRLIDLKYKSYNNVVVFEYDELNETSNLTLLQIVDNIYLKVKNLLPDIELDSTKCMERIQLMNKRYEEIKTKPFDYVDSFFQIHGSHRDRSSKTHALG